MGGLKACGRRWRPAVKARARRGRRHDQDESTGGRFVVSPMMTEYASAADSAPDLLHWADHGFDEGDFLFV